MPGVWEWIIIAVIVVLLFGANKLPDAARSLGRSMRIFKSEVKELNKDDNKAELKEVEGTQQVSDEKK